MQTFVCVLAQSVWKDIPARNMDKPPFLLAGFFPVLEAFAALPFASLDLSSCISTLSDAACNTALQKLIL